MSPRNGQCRCTRGHPRRVDNPGSTESRPRAPVVQRARDLLERGDQIRKCTHSRSMKSEPNWRRVLHGGEHGAPAVASLQHAATFGTTDRELSSDGERVAPTVEEAAQILLGLTKLIARGGVDGRAAGVGEPLEHRGDVIGIRSVAPAGSEHPCPKRQRRHAKTVVATEGEVLHRTDQPLRR
jgi:hypothetical protein